MNKVLKKCAAVLSLGIVALGAAPAMADPHDHGRWDDHHDRGRYDRHDGRWDRRGPDRVVVVRDRRPNRVVHVYDWNRPDPSYGGYYADRYYRGGYDSIRVTRQTRIYRGYDNRYYCRRSDGTTGLIVGAALGGLLGNQLGRGRSDTVATILGAGAGALLGREVDRGNVVCR